MKSNDPLTYQNRMDDVYYLQEGVTRTGKPKYYAGRKITGKLLDKMPDGFEFHEKPETAQVLVRKIKPSAITEFERAQVEAIVRREADSPYVIVTIEGNTIIVYTPMRDNQSLDQMIEILGGPLLRLGKGKGQLSPAIAALRESMMVKSQYHPMLRFELANPDARNYYASRWCFLGSIDDWFMLGQSGPLADLVERYAKHLGQESFYELM